MSIEMLYSFLYSMHLDNRFHTFGLGQEVSAELISRIAIITGGYCYLVEDRERLQPLVSEC